MTKCVFLDRDGTIIYDKGYIGKTADVKLVNGAAEAIKRLNKAGFFVIVVSNQSGVARGFFNEDAVTKVNAQIQRKLLEKGAYIDAFYWCPHFTEGRVQKYIKRCKCRKPEIGMLLRAKKDFNADFKKSYMIGDKATDIEAGRKAGCKNIFIVTKKEAKQEESLKKMKIFFKSKKLLEAATFIIKASK